MTRSTPARSPRYLVLGLGLAAALPISLARPPVKPLVVV